MEEFNLTILFASVIATATPILLATLGETISEKSGIINLSLDGTLLLCAMTGFVISFETNSLILGFAGAAVVGALISSIVGVFSIYLNQSQVAVGFVLTLMARDLAYFIGNPYSRIQGPQVAHMPIPFLEDIPFLGSVLFNHNITVYFSMLMIFACWWYLYKTPYGLKLRAVGEHPGAAFSRAINPRKSQMLYVIAGGLIIGIAGATFSLSTKAGWGRPQGAEGTGWIALALVIFGGWNPVKAAVGAYLFAFLQTMGIHFQSWFPSVPAQVFNMAPFPLMIFTLLIINFFQRENIILLAKDKPLLKAILRKLDNTAPTSLGKPYKPDEY
ncbi:MAG: ABC transporter permease [Proteobacteria bacterium]|nr:ABC transporter permease [Pseudomonadota bacterium]